MERHFDQELAELKNDILRMGVMVDAAIANSIYSLKQLSREAANKVISDDSNIDALEVKIDKRCVDLLALRQPMAHDLRFITMAMEITTDLERMADLAVDIAQRVLEISAEPMLKPLIDIPVLALIAQKMVKDVLESFVKDDADLAGRVIMADNEADALRNSIQKELVNDYMIKDPRTIKRAVAILLIARHLERICDHATNIAEDVIYMTKARFIKHRAEEGAGNA